MTPAQMAGLTTAPMSAPEAFQGITAEHFKAQATNQKPRPGFMECPATVGCFAYFLTLPTSNTNVLSGGRH